MTDSPPEEPKPKKRKRKTRLVNLAPGSLIADPSAPKPTISVTAYGVDGFVERKIEKPSEILSFLGKWPVTWVNVDGLGDAEIIAQLGEIFELHRLALEDVLHVAQRSKVEHFGTFTFIVTRLVELKEKKLHSEQLSIFLGENFVLTFQEDVEDSLGVIRDRIRLGRGRVRATGPDYLAYCILDSVVDSYFPVLEDYGERLDALEDVIVEHPDRNTIPIIHEIKRDLLTLRRAVWPQRDALNLLIRDELPLMTPETRIYLRDCYDHVVRIIDLVEMYRELGADLMDLYLSVVSFRMNEVMKVLTIIATIFIPLTFISGLYGMNFDHGTSPLNMPELHWYYGYPFALGLMAAVTLALLWYFRKKGWLSNGDGKERNDAGAKDA